MEKLDIFLWATMGLMLAVFMPVGLIMLAYLLLKSIHMMIGGTQTLGESIKETKIDEYTEHTLNEMK